MTKLSKKRYTDIKKIIKEREYLFNEFNPNWGIVKENIDLISSEFNIDNEDIILFLSVFRGYWFQFYYNEDCNFDEIDMSKYQYYQTFIAKVKELAFKNDNRELINDSEDLNDKLDIFSIFSSIVRVTCDIHNILNRTSSSTKNKPIKLF